jgi:hypothetical protein
MEYLVNVLVWIITVYGMSTIIVHSTLFNPLRNFLSYSGVVADEEGNIVEMIPRQFSLLGKLINCILCMGFWVGIFWGIMVWSPADTLFLNQDNLITPFLKGLFSGCLGSATTWLIYLKVFPLMEGK